MIGPADGETHSVVSEMAIEKNISYYDVYKSFIKIKIEHEKLLDHVFSNVLKEELIVDDVFLTYFLTDGPERQFFDTKKFRLYDDEKDFKIPIIKVYPEKVFIQKDKRQIETIISHEVIETISKHLCENLTVDWVLFNTKENKRVLH